MQPEGKTVSCSSDRVTAPLHVSSDRWATVGRHMCDDSRVPCMSGEHGRVRVTGEGLLYEHQGTNTTLVYRVEKSLPPEILDRHGAQAVLQRSDVLALPSRVVLGKQQYVFLRAE